MLNANKSITVPQVTRIVREANRIPFPKIFTTFAWNALEIET